MLPRLNTLSSKTFAAILCYLSLTLAVLAGALYFQLNQLAISQRDDMGQSLGTQLAESLKQPLIDDNSISMQVLLDNLLKDTPNVMRATIYTTNNRILAQSQRSLGGRVSLAVYTRPVTVDNRLLGQVRVELDNSQYFQRFYIPMWSTLAIWLVATVLLGLWLLKGARQYSQRLNRLARSFPLDDSARGLPELDQLELALEPFTRSASTEMEEADYSYSMLALNIPNLRKWQVQLNATAFNQMLARLDGVIDVHLSLFQGDRQGSRSSALLLRFDQVEGADHPLERAIHCANGLLRLCDQMAFSAHIPFELRIAAAYRSPAHPGSDWCNQIERESCVDRLTEILPIASPWELIIDKGNLEIEDLAGCQLEDLSAAGLWQFRQYDEDQAALFEKQVAILSSSLNS